MSQLYRLLEPGEIPAPGDEWQWSSPSRDYLAPLHETELDGEPHDGSVPIFRPVNGYVVDLDGVEPANVAGGLIDCRGGFEEEDEAEAHALRILAAVAKVRASWAWS